MLLFISIWPISLFFFLIDSILCLFFWQIPVREKGSNKAL